MATKPFTMISLFAGAGGLDIGLELAGFKTLAVNEFETHACDTLRQNKSLSNIVPSEFESWFESAVLTQRCYNTAVGKKLVDESKKRIKRQLGQHRYLQDAAVLEGDIRTITTHKLLAAAGQKKGELSLVAGGPPCQPFSRAGKRETVETGDGKLFLEFVRIVKEAQPRWFLFENVKGLAQSKTTVAYCSCESCGELSVIAFDERQKFLNDEICDTKCPVCNAKSQPIELKEERGGSLRIILNEFEGIGYKCVHRVLNSADFGVPQSRERLFIVGSRDAERFEWPESTHQERQSNKVKRQIHLFESDKPNWVTVKDILWKNGHPKYGKLDYSKAVIWVKNVVRPHDEPVTWSLDRPSPTVGAHQAAKLALAPYGVPPEQLARQQWHTLGKRQRDLPAVFVEHEMLSDEELLQLQTFPTGWYLHGTRMERAFQIGNAVPCLFAKAIGEAIIKAQNQNESK